jgi:hypothetical protein
MGDIAIAERTVQRLLDFSGDLAGVMAFGYSDFSPPPPMDAPPLADTARVVWHRPDGLGHHPGDQGPPG